MNKCKDFDCVQMKRDIQRRLAEELQNMDPQSIRQAECDRIVGDPVLGPFLRKVAVSHLVHSPSQR
jgi:hypothetical protein